MPVTEEAFERVRDGQEDLRNKVVELTVRYDVVSGELEILRKRSHDHANFLTANGGKIDQIKRDLDRVSDDTKGNSELLIGANLPLLSEIVRKHTDLLDKQDHAVQRQSLISDQIAMAVRVAKDFFIAVASAYVIWRLTGGIHP